MNVLERPWSDYALRAVDLLHDKMPPAANATFGMSAHPEALLANRFGQLTNARFAAFQDVGQASTLIPSQLPHTMWSS